MNRYKFSVMKRIFNFTFKRQSKFDDLVNLIVDQMNLVCETLQDYIIRRQSKET